MKHIIKTILLVVALMISATGNVWAVDKWEQNGFKVFVERIPGDDISSKSNVGVAITSGGVVTLTVTPPTGYYTKKSMITATPMIDANAAPRRSSIIGTLDVSGSVGEIDNSTPGSYNINLGTYSGAYVTVQFYQKTDGFTQIFSLSDIDNFSETAKYEIVCDIDASGFSGFTTEFKGTLDGGLHTIMNLDTPLFKTVNGAIIRNVILDKVGINISTSSTNVGAIACEAKGASRIYNCGILSGRVGGTGDVGGIVGKLNNTSSPKEGARVINCFSYATITGGNNVGGIVGNNTYGSKATDIRTMVMNCMFYGDITGGTNISPVYGGSNINNKKSDGLTTYNYYAYDQLKTKAISDGKYNCALAVEEKYLNRFEFYRLLLNSNKKLAAFYASKDGATVSPEDMAKWVLETADRSRNSTPMPFPILKKQGRYPSIINFDTEHAPDSASVGRNHGGKLGKTLSVKISSVGTNAPDNATLINQNGNSVSELNLTIIRTDKDTIRYNFNYDKIQLPYYNDVGLGNYTTQTVNGNKVSRVVTGWKITSVTKGTEGTFKEADEWGGYNFADRKCTKKDVYTVSHRVFSQGAYYDVPYGVTGITIEPYWGQAAYVSDQYYDVVYDNNYNAQLVSQTGQQYDFSTVNNVLQADADINGETQKVYTTMDNARKSMSIPEDASVYDYAVVLVGNVHQATELSYANTPYTIMSVDLDKDKEPDYSFIFSHNQRKSISPIRFDFLNVVGTAQAQKPNGATLLRNVSLFNPTGWFEVTNTCLMYFVQFECDNSLNADLSNNEKSMAPVIFLGGVIDQFTSTQKSPYKKTGELNNTRYVHVGGNVWFKSFGYGTHSDGSGFTPHVPISVTGGDFNEFYLTGTYQPQAAVKADNAECYISGGRFGEVAGAAQEKVDGNVRWQIYDADIKEFFGGGINASNAITGNIEVDIINSHVTTYCGGPKFGDMSSSDKTVITRANGCVFGKYFGAGYGGTSYSRVKYYDKSGTDLDWNTWQSQYSYNGTDKDRGKYFPGTTAYKTSYGNKGPGVATDFDYEFFVWSSGTVGGRFYVKFASFSLAKTYDVSSTLTKCIINGNFYGGGSLGKVDGTATSVLDGCTVNGNVFGGGYSATLPTVPIRDGGFSQNPKINTSSGMLEPGIPTGITEYHWVENTLSNNTLAINPETKEIYTNANLKVLGQVAQTNLTIKGNTVVHGIVDGKADGGVFGGGDESKTNGTTTVNIEGGTVNSVYGGGNVANVSGDTKVILLGGTVNGDVYGGGKGRLEEGTEGDDGYVSPVPATVGSATVYLNGYETGTTTTTVDEEEKGCVVKGCIFGCNNLNGSPLGDVLVHVYGTQNAGKETIGEKFGISEMDESVTSDYGKLQYWITQAEKNEVDKEIIDAAKSLTESATSEAINAQIAILQPATENAAASHENEKYDVKAVYGGGNLAAYLPTDYKTTTKFAEVIIDGCGLTSIKQVYGGGNAASTPATKVTVNGTYEIEELFGGGNGKDALPDGSDNPGANVGFKDYSAVEMTYDTKEKRQQEVFTSQYVYGSGKAAVNIFGGKIHRVFGGSNTKGNVRQTAVTMLDERSSCDFLVDEAYGGGKSAPMDAKAQLLMACIPGLKQAYGGAEAADIMSDVELNITNGTFDRVFGGNNLSGTIRGSITVNVEETGCKPIIIGELYGGGNEAAYSVYGYKKISEGDDEVWKPRESLNDNQGAIELTYAEDTSGNPVKYRSEPTVNVKSFTSIGDIYGGGYGNSATMVGNPIVNINVTKGRWADDDKSLVGTNVTTHNGYPVPSHAKEAIGAINNVFGGGNAAKVIGNTTVNVGSEESIQQTKLDDNYIPVTDSSGNPIYEIKPVDGADIRGNVYGGGNNAEVTGSTNVTIGKKEGE